MAQASQSQLLELINQCSTVGELDTRVSHQFGAEHVAAARLLAVRVNGARWVFESHAEPPSEIYKVFRILGKPSNIVLLGASLCAVIALLWPPIILKLQDGSSWHMGFFSIFVEPSETKRGSINISLLLSELLVIYSVGAVLWLIARQIERRNSFKTSSEL